MKKPILAVVSAAAVLAVVRAQTAPPPQQPSVDLPAELQRVLSDYETAWSAKEEKALAAIFAEDGFVLPSGNPPVRGRANIEKFYADAGSPLSLRAFAFATEGNVGYILGGFTGKKGDPDIGKFTLTLKKVEGKWMIMSDMDNGNRR